MGILFQKRKLDFWLHSQCSVAEQHDQRGRTEGQTSWLFNWNQIKLSLERVRTFIYRELQKISHILLVKNMHGKASATWGIFSFECLACNE